MRAQFVNVTPPNHRPGIERAAGIIELASQSIVDDLVNPDSTVRDVDTFVKERLSQLEDHPDLQGFQAELPEMLSAAGKQIRDLYTDTAESDEPLEDDDIVDLEQALATAETAYAAGLLVSCFSGVPPQIHDRVLEKLLRKGDTDTFLACLKNARDTVTISSEMLARVANSDLRLELTPSDRQLILEHVHPAEAHAARDMLFRIAR